MNKYMLKSFISFLVFLIITGCSSSLQLKDTTVQNGYKNPRLIEADFIIEVTKNSEVNLDSLKTWNIGNGIPENDSPKLLLWASDIIDRDNQRIIENKIEGTKPTNSTIEFENQNKIDFWDLSDYFKTTDTVKITRHFKCITYDYSPVFNESIKFEEYKKIPADFYYFYTKAEPSLEQTPDIIKAANIAAGDGDKIIKKAKNIFSWVRSKMEYVYPPDKRGVLNAFETFKGDCGQYSALFVTLCRSVGIAARQQSGFAIADNSFGYHVWSEIYLPGDGWIPVDATHEDGFAHLTNNRVYASVGMNIPLVNVPSWANYNYHDAQGNRTDFMQFLTTVINGFDVKFNNKRKLIRFEEIK